MTSHIAYPDELLDDGKLNEFYKDVSILFAERLGKIGEVNNWFDSRNNTLFDVILQRVIFLRFFIFHSSKSTTRTITRRF